MWGWQAASTLLRCWRTRTHCERSVLLAGCGAADDAERNSWPFRQAGRGGSTNGCAVAGVLQPTGWGASRGGTRRYSCCGPSGRCRRLGRKSRMRREPHVRFCKGAGVKFPRATRLLITNQSSR